MSPRDIYIGGTLISILISLYLFVSGKRETGIFVGLWAPTVLQLGEALLARVEEE
jgi:predicted PurR-regulated permease PerM